MQSIQRSERISKEFDCVRSQDNQYNKVLSQILLDIMWPNGLSHALLDVVFQSYLHEPRPVHSACAFITSSMKI